MSLAAQIEIQANEFARRQRVRVGASSCDGDADKGDGLYTRDAAVDWMGDPFRTPGNDGQASSVVEPVVEGRQRPKKPDPSLL